MTLLIAILIIHGLHLGWGWYLLAVAVWGLRMGLTFIRITASVARTSPAPAPREPLRERFRL